MRVQIAQATCPQYSAEVSSASMLSNTTICHQMLLYWAACTDSGLRQHSAACALTCQDPMAVRFCGIGLLLLLRDGWVLL